MVTVADEIQPGHARSSDPGGEHCNQGEHVTTAAHGAPQPAPKWEALLSGKGEAKSTRSRNVGQMHGRRDGFN